MYEITKELKSTFDWSRLKEESKVTFFKGLKNLANESNEVKENFESYELALKSQSINIFHKQYRISTLSIRYEIQLHDERIGYYEYITDLKLDFIDEWLVFD